MRLLPPARHSFATALVPNFRDRGIRRPDGDDSPRTQPALRQIVRETERLPRRQSFAARGTLCEVKKWDRKYPPNCDENTLSPHPNLSPITPGCQLSNHPKVGSLASRSAALRNAAAPSAKQPLPDAACRGDSGGISGSQTRRLPNPAGEGAADVRQARHLQELPPIRSGAAHLLATDSLAANSLTLPRFTPPRLTLPRFTFPRATLARLSLPRFTLPRRGRPDSTAGR